MSDAVSNELRNKPWYGPSPGDLVRVKESISIQGLQHEVNYKVVDGFAFIHLQGLDRTYDSDDFYVVEKA